MTVQSRFSSCREESIIFFVEKKINKKEKNKPVQRAVSNIWVWPGSHAHSVDPKICQVPSALQIAVGADKVGIV